MMTLENGETYNGLSLEHLGVAGWEKIEVTPDVLLFSKDIYKPEDDCSGFDFCCLEFHCQLMDGETDPIFYDVMFHGRAYFDGVRHLYFGKEECHNYGYLYYPKPLVISDALQVLENLCHKKGCNK